MIPPGEAGMRRRDLAAKIIAREVDGMEHTRVRHVYAVRALDVDGHLLPDLPEPKIDNDGWATWDSEYVTEAGYHPEKGLWTYDDGRMVQDSPDRLREVAYIYLAAADYAERNQN